MLHSFVYFAYLSVELGSLKLVSCRYRHNRSCQVDILLFAAYFHLRNNSINVKICDFSLSFELEVTQYGLRIQKLHCWQATSLIYIACLDGVLKNVYFDDKVYFKYQRLQFFGYFFALTSFLQKSSI